MRGAKHVPDAHTDTSAVSAKYLGFNEKQHRFIFLKDGERLWGHGSLYKAFKSTTSQHALKPYKTTRESDAFEHTGAKLRCIGHKTGKAYMFRGELIAEAGKSFTAPPASKPTADLAGKQPTPPVQKQDCANDAVPPTTAARPTAEAKTTRRAERSYEDRLHELTAQRKAGLDPYVDLKFLIQHLDESRATIYRKTALGKFPLPIKRGGGRINYWLFSEIEAYKAGAAWGANHA